MGNIFNAFLKVLFDREVVLDISESNFTFSDGSDKDISFIEFSNGAKTKIEAALIFTLNILFENYGTKSDLLFCDEIFDKGVDFCNLGKIIDVLRQFFIKNKKVFIVSHKEIGDMIDNRIIVERKNNTSILVGD
jgi:DNA repair exonuclease SbcCD ATPase subunit